jgi:hypothetical protein
MVHDVPDYSEMRSKIRELNDRAGCLAELDCPDITCPGTLTRDGDTVECTDCRMRLEGGPGS